MLWKKHSELEGKHSILSPSRHTWLRYDDSNLEDKLYSSYLSDYATTLGTVLHAYAASKIKFGMKMHKYSRDEVIFYCLNSGIPRDVLDVDAVFDNLSNYINDSINYRLDPEVPLYFSKWCFGTADAISYNERKKFLQIHDLKTGKSPVSMDQLLIYASLACLEYQIKPGETDFELRIYQDEHMQIANPTAEEILPVMDRIITCSKILDNLHSE